MFRYLTGEIAGLDDTVKEAKADLQQAKEIIPSLEEMVNKPFKQAQELKEAKARLDVVVEAELSSMAQNNSHAAPDDQVSDQAQGSDVPISKKEAEQQGDVGKRYKYVNEDGVADTNGEVEDLDYTLDGTVFNLFVHKNRYRKEV